MLEGVSFNGPIISIVTSSKVSGSGVVPTIGRRWFVSLLCVCNHDKYGRILPRLWLLCANSTLSKCSLAFSLYHYKMADRDSLGSQL